jgi:hypothetical protein
LEACGMLDTYGQLEVAQLLAEWNRN